MPLQLQILRHAAARHHRGAATIVRASAFRTPRQRNSSSDCCCNPFLQVAVGAPDSSFGQTPYVPVYLGNTISLQGIRPHLGGQPHARAEAVAQRSLAHRDAGPAILENPGLHSRGCHS